MAKTKIPIKAKREKAAAKAPARELVKRRARKQVTKFAKKKILSGIRLTKRPKASDRGIVIAKKAASQFGWPNVEKMRRVGWKSCDQQVEASFPLIKKQLGS